MSDGLPRIDSRDLIRALRRAGFEEQRQRGSHLHLRRAVDKRRVTIPVHAGRVIPPGTLKGILRDAGISEDELRELLS
jgi:predicted RNA binding protein YcfA (HicA-like mRNA interferase family)